MGLFFWVLVLGNLCAKTARNAAHFSLLFFFGLSVSSCLAGSRTEFLLA